MPKAVQKKKKEKKQSKKRPPEQKQHELPETNNYKLFKIWYLLNRRRDPIGGEWSDDWASNYEHERSENVFRAGWFIGLMFTSIKSELKYAKKNDGRCQFTKIMQHFYKDVRNAGGKFEVIYIPFGLSDFVDIDAEENGCRQRDPGWVVCNCADEQHIIPRICAQYKVRSAPTLVIVDGNGWVVLDGNKATTKLLKAWQSKNDWPSVFDDMINANKHKKSTKSCSIM